MNKYMNDEARAERDLENLMGKGPGSESNGQTGAGENLPDATIDGQVPPQQSDDGYRQRYLTLQGIMKSEREKWQIKEEGLLLKIKSLEENQQSGVNEQVDVDDDFRSNLVTDEVRRSLSYRRMAEVNGQRHTEIHFESLADQNRKREEPPAPVVDKNLFFAQLDRLAKNWRTFNDDDGFNNFIDQVIPYSGGTTFRARLSQAVENLDAVSAAQFFLDYEEQTISARTTQSPDNLVSPPRRGSETHSSAENNNGKIYTRKEWDGLWKMLEMDNLPADKARALEMDLTLALGENRVVG